MGEAPGGTDSVERVTVKRAVDGDTLELTRDVEGTDTVRLIGLDTPEMATKEAAVPEPYAEEAAAFSAENLEGKDVYLQFDEDLKDDYGRLLAYVFLEDPSSSSADQPDALFNETLLREGYASLFTVEPDVRYEDRFKAAEASAKEEGLRIWGLEASGSTQPATSETPEVVPAADQDPLDLPAGTTGSTTIENTEDPSTMGGGTTVEPLEDTSSNLEPQAIPETTGLGETTVGTTFGTTSGTTMAMPGATSEESFDPEALKKEATQLAQESLDLPPANAGTPLNAPAGTPSVTPDPGVDTESAPQEIPVSQMTEPPVSSLPETGGLTYLPIAGFLIGFGLLIRVAHKRITSNTEED